MRWVYVSKIPWDTTETSTAVRVPSENATARASIGSWTRRARWSGAPDRYMPS